MQKAKNIWDGKGFDIFDNTLPSTGGLFPLFLKIQYCSILFWATDRTIQVFNKFNPELNYFLLFSFKKSKHNMFLLNLLILFTFNLIY